MNTSWVERPWTTAAPQACAGPLRRCLGLGCAAALGCSLAVGEACALEIYGNEVVEPAVLAVGDGEFAVATQTSRAQGSLPGSAPSGDRDAETRLQLAQVWGLGGGWQAAAEAVLFDAPGGAAGLDGWKLCVQHSVAADSDAPLSVSAVAALSGDRHGAWAAELRPVLALQAGDWRAALNPLVVLDSSGGSSVAPCAKLLWQPPRGVTLGLEYYAELGPLEALGAAGQALQQAVYAGLDADFAGAAAGPWHLSVAAGQVLGSAGAEDWRLKASLQAGF